MANIKVIYKNADGYDQEHSESGDSVKMASFSTANYTIDDTAAGQLVGGGDGSGAHHHDGRYFQETEHINASTGASDAAKPVITDAAGLLDNSFIDVSGLNALLDHGTLTGLGDDDHTQYLKTDGTRNLTGVQAYASHPSFTADTQLVDKKYVDDLAAGLEWWDSALTKTATPPGSPASGARYLIIATASGAWVGKEDQVAEWNGSAWVYQVPTAGTHIAIDDEPNSIYLYSGSAWTAQSYEVTTASTGLTKVGNDIQLDSSSAGNGLAFSSGVLSVNVTGALEIAADTLQVKADGINDLMIDFGTGTNQVSAADLPIADAGGYFSTDNVESALAQLAGSIQAVGVDYTVDTGGVTKGYPVYISNYDSVSAYTALSNSARIIGVALTTESAGATVKVLANDTIVTGVLTGAVAGATYYWNGSALSTSIPTGGGSQVWKMGQAKNATDLHVEIEHIKKNA